MRLLSDIGWVILLVITPWWLFERFFLPACERSVRKRLVEMVMARLKVLKDEL